MVLLGQLDAMTMLPGWVRRAHLYPQCNAGCLGLICLEWNQLKTPLLPSVHLHGHEVMVPRWLLISHIYFGDKAPVIARAQAHTRER